MKKYLSYVPKTGYVAKVKKSCSDHPVIAGLIALLVVAAIVFTIIAIVKMVNREEEALEDVWELEDDDEPLYFYPNEDDFVEGE